MPVHTTYRPAAPADGPALEALVAATADAGLIGFTDEYQADLLAVHRALADDLHGAVAVRADRVVAMALADLHPVRVSGELVTGAYLSHLRVHPGFQRQGVATGLAAWGLEYLAALGGPGVVPYAAIMQGNLSLKLAARYGFQATPPIRGGVVPVRRRAPSIPADLEVRPARPEELPALAEGMNAYYREHNLWSPSAPERLVAFLAREAAGVRPNQLLVAVRAGRLVAGLSLTDATGLVRMRVARAPWTVRLLGAWLGLLPRSGVLRALTVRRLWFAPGELSAARGLWEALRYSARGRADGLGIAFDPRDPAAAVYRVPVWLPTFPARYLVRAPGELDADRPTYCIAGP